MHARRYSFWTEGVNLRSVEPGAIRPARGLSAASEYRLGSIESLTERRTRGDRVSDNDPEVREGGRSLTVRRLPGDVSVVSVSGDVDGDKPSLMGRLLAGELAREPTQLVLELSRATSVDSTFVEALVGASALAGEADTSFCLIMPPTGPVVEALTAADLIERFEIFATVGEARLRR